MLGNSVTDSDKNIVLSFSLLMRLFEFAKEDAKTDIALHRVMEKLVAFSDGHNPLKMDTYETIIDGANDGLESENNEEGEYASDEDLENAYELGKKQADNGMDFGDDITSVAGPMITAVKDNGYGASNAEIEQFSQGYKEEQPCESCSDLESYYNQYREPLTLLSIDENGNISFCDDCQKNEPDEVEDEINKIVSLARM